MTAGLTRVALDERTPVGNGVLTFETHEQAWTGRGAGVERGQGRRGVVAALETAHALRALREHAGRDGVGG